MKYVGGTAPINHESARIELLDHELATGSLISKDGRSTNVLVYLRVPEPGAPGTATTQARWQQLVDGLRTVRTQWEGQLPERLRLAGVPLPVVKRAGSILAALETRAGRLTEAAALPLFAAAAPETEVETVDHLREAVMAVDPDALTPRKALEALYRLRGLV